jgi:protein tyrosine/serine phosphatase
MRSITVPTLAFLLLLAPMLEAQALPAQAAASADDLSKRHLALGLGNLHKVTTNLYRSAQPEGETAFRELVARYGIKTVVSLRTVGRDEPITSGMGIRLTRFPMHAGTLERDSVVAALRELRLGTRRGPTLLHCEWGADRTGAIIALYRILYQKWNREDAIAEMMALPYGFHPMWTNIPTFIRQADIEQLRREIGVR